MVGERRLRAATLHRRQRFLEERFSVGVVEIQAAEAVDPAQNDRVIVRILLQGGPDFQGEVAAIGAVGVAAVADDDRLDVLEPFPEFRAGEGPQNVGRKYAHLDSLVAKFVRRDLGGFRGGVEQDDGYFRIFHPVVVHDGILPSG